MRSALALLCFTALAAGCAESPDPFEDELEEFAPATPEAGTSFSPTLPPSNPSVPALPDASVPSTPAFPLYDASVSTPPAPSGTGGGSSTPTDPFGQIIDTLGGFLGLGGDAGTNDAGP